MKEKTVINERFVKGIRKLNLAIILVLLFCGTAISRNVAGVEEDKPKPMEIQGRSAIVKSVQGIAAILKKGSDSWDKLLPDMKLNEGDQVSISADSVIVIDVDGNILSLSEGALFNFKKLTSEIEIELWHGKMKAKVKKLSSDMKFNIRTPVANCSVRGTEFDVEVSGDYTTKVRTQSGSVAVKDIATGKEVIVEPGYQCTVKPGKAGPELKPIETEKPEGKAITKDEKKRVSKGDIEEGEPEEEQVPPRKEKKTPAAGLGINGSFGADVLVDPDNPDQNKIYYSLSLLPEFSIWRFGVGLDLNIYSDEEGNIRSADWDDWDDIVGKIWYIRYGKRKDPLFALIGGLRSYTLGNGFILNSYTNMLDYPDVRNKGLLLEVNLTKMGFESVISNINSYPVIGGRIYVRPLQASVLPLVKNITLGITGVLDQNPDKNNGTKNDEIIFYGADLGLPLVNMLPLTVRAYFDYSTYNLGSKYDIKNNGRGTAVGLGGTVVKIVKYGFEYRRIDNNFIPRYFDAYYEVERSSKPFIISDSRGPVREGPYLMVGVDLLNKVALTITYEDYNTDSADRYPYLHGELQIDPSLLMNKYSIKISYDKKNVNSFKDIAKLEGAIMTTEIGYKIAPNIMLVITQKQTFDENGESTRIMYMRTSFSF